MHVLLRRFGSLCFETMVKAILSGTPDLSFLDKTDARCCLALVAGLEGRRATTAILLMSSPYRHSVFRRSLCLYQETRDGELSTLESVDSTKKTKTL